MRRFIAAPIVALLLVGACAPKPEGPAAAATAMVDTAAVKSGLDSLRTRYIALQTGGDATGLAGLFTETGGVDIYGLPRLRGRAAIETAFKGDFAARKDTLTQIMPISMTARTGDAASEIGTYHDMHDVNGAKDHEWGRYVGAFEKGTDGQWRIAYLMAFPDSTKAEQ
jgi:ketosteroid isomerase-like protein